MKATNRNNRAMMQALLNARPGDQIDLRILESIRNLFQPHLMRNEAMRELGIVGPELLQRQMCYPTAQSREEVITFFNIEIASRYPDTVAQAIVTRLLNNQIVRTGNPEANVIQRMARVEVIEATRGYPQSVINEITDRVLRHPGLIQRMNRSQAPVPPAAAPPVAAAAQLIGDIPQEALFEDAAANPDHPIILDLAQAPRWENEEPGWDEEEYDAQRGPSDFLDNRGNCQIL